MENLSSKQGGECSSVRSGQREKSCTSLLHDPDGVLSNRERWPDHLCYQEFLRTSCELWARRVAGQSTPTVELWAGSYPLPIGREAVRELYAWHGRCLPDQLLERLTLEGRQRALWALRVMGDRSVLDMFGLEYRSAPADGDLHFSGLAYSLWGIDDVSLVELMRAGHSWWRDFSWEKIRGRPKGSGMFPTLADFERDALAALRELRNAGERLTQRNLAARLSLSYDRTRELLKELKKQHGVSWQALKNRAQ